MRENKETLAILGGEPTRKEPFPPYPIIGEEEIAAVNEVLKSGHLSSFAASAGSGFLGGKKVREFEEKFAEYHGIGYAIAVNSATAGLHISLAAAGVGPGDEVIVPPYTFTSTATSVLMHNAVPVFVDVDPRTYCLDPAKVEGAITPFTKAIIPVHLLGHPAEMNPIMRIAKEHDLTIIEDCAQSPGAKYKGKLVGTIGDLAVFSFQETKNMMTGEGGMVITNDLLLAERCRMVRNHGEAVIEGKSRSYLSNIIGWNYRMTEIEAAIGMEQLKKLDGFNEIRIRNSKFLSRKLSKVKGVGMPYEAPDISHVYHVYGMTYDEREVDISRGTFVNALNAEGIPFGTGYPHPLYENPLFNERIAYGDKGCPFTCKFYKGGANYESGICPVAEDLCYSRALWLFSIRPPATLEDMRDVVDAFMKIIENIEQLQELNEKQSRGRII
ncbi:MAG: DegT/DnrJ/EryC1/StrS family aminotransferase [Deltaproteobacteria bacterium]|nr:MAG: DegT/DnrJ/EryC1/StrS family aminotransferase [Deltaproteobacteria bacterium]